MLRWAADFLKLEPPLPAERWWHLGAIALLEREHATAALSLALKSAVSRTGGALYEKVHESLPDRFARVLQDFRNGYLLTYSPTGVPASGWHDITVRTKNPKYRIRARAGYVK